MANISRQQSNIYATLRKMWRRSVWRDSGGAILGFSFVKLFQEPDTIDHEVPTVKKAERKEKTGRERLRMMFSYDEYGNMNPELSTVVHGAMLGAFTGSFIGGTIHSKESYLKFIEKNQGTAFQNVFEAKKQLQTKVTLGFARGAWMLGWRLGLFCGSFMLFATGISVYRGKSSFIEYTTAGTITGSLYKLKQGPRAMVAGGIIGGALGTIAGFTNLLIMYLTGVSLEEARYWQYQWKEEHNEKKLKSLREARSKDLDVLTKDHQERLTSKVDILPDTDNHESRDK